MKTSEYCVERKREDEGNSNTKTLLNFAFEVEKNQRLQRQSVAQAD